MRAGELRHRVAIQEQTDTSDGMGGYTTAWADVQGMDSEPAAIWPLRSNERIDAMKLESNITCKIRIRYRSGITSKNRIYWAQGEKTFNIEGEPINPDFRNIYLDFMCSEDT